MLAVWDPMRSQEFLRTANSEHQKPVVFPPSILLDFHPLSHGAVHIHVLFLNAGETTCPHLRLVVGTWGLQHGQTIPAVLQMSCDQIQVFKLQGPSKRCGSGDGVDDRSDTYLLGDLQISSGSDGLGSFPKVGRSNFVGQLLINNN